MMKSSHKPQGPSGLNLSIERLSECAADRAVHAIEIRANVVIPGYALFILAF